MSCRRCVVLVPAPFQGHITPMLQLGTILQSRGFSIVVAHTEYNAPDPSNHSTFTFVPLPDGVAGYDKSFMNMLSVITAINDNCRTPFQDYLVQMIEKEEIHGQLACVIYDRIMYFAEYAASNLRLPSIVMRAYNVTYELAHQTVFRLRAESCLPLPVSQMEDTVPELQPFKFKDMPLPLTMELPDGVFEYLEETHSIGSSQAVIWNSMDELECLTISLLQQKFPVPFFCICPLHKMAPPAQTSLLEEDSSCIDWLDKKAPHSVLYVSLGSIATMDEKELMEAAWGLLQSEQPFLWVIRRGSGNGVKGEEKIPDGLEKIIGERGRIVKWAPQKKVLAHSAVGGFWSHCGWNSTLESLSEGIPMICRPDFSDQMINARYVTEVWKVGLQLEHSVDRGVVENVVRRLMVDAEGREMRRRAAEMKHKFEVSVQKGGPSYESLKNLTEFISSLSLYQ